MDTSINVHNSDLIPSPSLLFYEEKIRQNIDTALNIAGDSLRLRPHVKTHKTKEIVQLQMNAGIQSLSVPRYPKQRW